jgi:hypothetical protein
VIYLDTLVLGALFFREPTAPAILAHLETVGKAAELSAFNRFVSDSLRLAEVEPGDFCAAIMLLDTPALALRAGNVLHLAIVRRLRASLATLDAHQSMAANRYGIPIFRVS